MVYPTSEVPSTDLMQCVSYVGARRVIKLIIGNVFAVLLYISCALYLPSFGIAELAGKDNKTIASSFSMVLFTLLIWTAFTYHYFLLGGGIKFASATSWELRATGLCMITSPKVHKMITFFGLFVSLLAAYHCIVFDTLMRNFMSAEHGSGYGHDVMFKGLILRAHTVFCILMNSYCVFRILYDPKIMGARKRFLNQREQQERQIQPTVPSVRAENWPTADKGPQECAICTQRAANRQLRCGHVICCCCIARLASIKICVLCPFCRMEVFNARKLLVEPEVTTVPLMHCDGCGCNDDEETKCNEGRKEEEEIVHRRESIESVEEGRDGARALLIPMQDEPLPNLGI